jgi:two-component system, NtrC family, response regulator HydG
MALQMNGRILVVDDQKNMRLTTSLLLKAEGHQCLEASSGPEALEALSHSPVDVVLTDLRMEPMDGLELLKRILQLAPQTQVIMMTAYGSIDSAVEAMRQGAFDYLTKPFRDGELAQRVAKALERIRLLSQVDLFAGEFQQRHGLSALVGNSPSMRELTAKIARVAPTDATVLIEGESGTGKELVARAIHALSLRVRKPFVPVNCAAISESLLESELFGHAKGSFTGALRARSGVFEEANGGSIFIDEVTETSPAFQSKLLRVIQEGEVRRVGENIAIHVDVRTIAATNRELEAEVGAKRFRQDLFYRLAVVTLRVPPLHERLEDVPALAQFFLAKSNTRSGRRKNLTPAALSHLSQHQYPGNVRELENLIEQAAALSEGDELFPQDFPLTRTPSHGVRLASAPEPTALSKVVMVAEKRAILSALESSQDLGKVAELLQVSPTTLWRKMRRLGLKDPRWT